MVIYKSKFPSQTIPDINLYSFLLQRNNINSSDKAAFIDGASGKSLSYKDSLELSARMARGWQEQVGLGKNDVIAVFAPNQYNHIVVYLSILAAKCTISPGNPGYTKDEFRHQISNSTAKAIVTIPQLLPPILEICSEVGIPTERIFLFGDAEVNGCRPISTLLSDSPISSPIQDVSGDDVALISYSSGTTGLPKGVMVTHRNLVAQIVLVDSMDKEGRRPDEVVLGFLPFYHIFGLTSLVFNAFSLHIPVVVMQAFNLELMCKLIEQYRITMMAIVPPIAVLLAKHPLVEKYDLSSIRQLSCGAAPLGREHIEALFKRIPANIRQGYGMTETTAGVISQSRDDVVPGSIGVLLPNIECMIVNENGKELGDNQEGELLFRGPSIMKGYFNNPKANKETFTEGGWMRTGDVGKFDSATGHFFILDRIKELIKYKGFQVAPAELEAVLMGCREVGDCCVVGVYNSEQATEIPRAYIVLQPGVQPTDKVASDIRNYITKRVSGHKKLRGGVRFVDAIPKNPSGKILRKTVKEWVKQEQASTRPAKL